MSFLFSPSTQKDAPASIGAMDIQLLSDAELLSVWEQSQWATIMLQERGIPMHIATRYSYIVENELKNRAALRPELLVVNSLAAYKQDDTEANGQQDNEQMFKAYPSFVNKLIA